LVPSCRIHDRNAAAVTIDNCQRNKQRSAERAGFDDKEYTIVAAMQSAL
jgi:hypothetical protein